MLSKLTTTHIVLIFIGVSAIGILLGKNWDKWFAPGKNAAGGKGGKVASGCPTVNGEQCCPPRRWRFNGVENASQCV